MGYNAAAKHTDEIDIVIVGAGPAGISTWLHLNKLAPHLADSTILIDKAKFPREKLCAGGVGAWSEDVLNELEIDLAIPSLFLFEVEFRYRDKKWSFNSPNRFRMVRRMDFDMALVEEAKKRGLVFHENEAFVAVERQQTKLMVTTNHGRYVAKTLVGADGALSRVRRLMIGHASSCLATAMQVSAPVNPKYDSEYGPNKMLIDFTAIDDGLQGYTWHFPCPNNEALYLNHGIVHFGLYGNKPRVDLKTLFRQALKDHQISVIPGTWSSHPIRWFSNRAPIAGHNVILAGDAAGIEPALGGGIPMALSYGEIASRAIVQAFQDHDFSFQNYDNLLSSHFLGRHLEDYGLLAKKLYAGGENPLTLLREFFTERMMRRQLEVLLKG